jgi:RNA polymerase sigma-70 factor (ECF subfamily)
MAEENQFLTLIQRVREGDEQAATELFTRYEQHILRVARNRLRDQRLRRILDSVDIRQSVMKSFFLRMAMGQFEINSPEDLLKLLATMVKNKVVDKARRVSSPKGGGDRVHQPIDETPVAKPGESPSQIVAGKELLEEAQRRLSAEELQMRQLRAEGLEWVDIAEKMGGTAEARRKQYARAMDRLAEELGLTDE